MLPITYNCMCCFMATRYPSPYFMVGDINCISFHVLTVCRLLFYFGRMWLSIASWWDVLLDIILCMKSKLLPIILLSFWCAWIPRSLDNLMSIYFLMSPTFAYELISSRFRMIWKSLIELRFHILLLSRSRSFAIQKCIHDPCRKFGPYKNMFSHSNRIASLMKQKERKMIETGSKLTQASAWVRDRYYYLRACEYAHKSKFKNHRFIQTKEMWFDVSLC